MVLPHGFTAWFYRGRSAAPPGRHRPGPAAGFGPGRHKAREGADGGTRSPRGIADPCRMYRVNGLQRGDERLARINEV